MQNFNQLSDHCDRTRRYFLQLGSLAAAACGVNLRSATVTGCYRSILGGVTDYL